MSASSESIEDETSEMKPYQTMRGHTGCVRGVAHLPDGQCIITYSDDGTLRLWERESGAQIGNAWEDEEDDEKENNKGLLSMALSPNGKTVATGHMDGTVKLWDMEMKKVTAKWTGHSEQVRSVYWNGDGRRVVSGSYDGTARVWDVESGETVLGPIETGHQEIDAVAFSPDTSKFATGGYQQHAIKIWDARTGELLSTLEQDSFVRSLVWTSDQKKLLAGNGDGSITIFDTATWQQIALLEDEHRNAVYSLSLFHNDRLLASASADKTARLWSLDTNLPVGPPLQHQDWVNDTAFSADGRFLATACDDNNAYVWDIHAILQEAGLEHLLSSSNVTAGKSILDSDATRHPKKPKEHLTVAPGGFFDSSTPPIDPLPPTVHLDPPPATPPDDLPPAHHDALPSTRARHRLLAPFTLAGARALLGRISPYFNRSQPSTVQPTELQQFSRPGDVSVQGPAHGEVSAAQDYLSCPSSDLPPFEHPLKPWERTLHQSQDHIHSSTIPTTPIHHSSSVHRPYDAQAPPAGPRTYAVLNTLLPHFRRRPQPNIDASMELQQRPVQHSISGHSGTAVVEVPEIRDKQALYVAPHPVPVRRKRKKTLLARCFAVLCCAPAEESGGS